MWMQKYRTVAIEEMFRWSKKSFLWEFPCEERSRNFRRRRTCTVHVRNFSSEVNLLSKKEHEEFSSFFPEVVNTLIDVEPWIRNEESRERLKDVLEHNVNFWTNSRGVGTVSAYKALEKRENITKKNIELANILGWCARLYEASLIIQDDIIDASETRGNVLCWYKNKDIGLNIAIVDAIYLNAGIFWILRKYFSASPQYLALLEIFHDLNFGGALSQRMELMPCNLNNFCMEHYKSLAQEKGSLAFTFIFMAMTLANYPEELHERIRPILKELGLFYQIQNDYIDFFGDPETTGKIGTDIRKGALTWLAVKALEKADRAQRAKLEDNYGKIEPHSIQIIGDLYNEMNLQKEYKKCEMEMYRSIYLQIMELPKELNLSFFLAVLDALIKGKWLT
ncbi:farnesyl pyrophosphate synthase-like [Leptinotarsa decemlineata]|uniref:farnesyl pyrophosphate synthase-like n=1 Tax=Leptinotarsa decemlineata TaxID=7539 RepID=UPI003D30AE38